MDHDTHSLAGIGLLSELSAGERAPLEKSCGWRRYAAHEQIIDRYSESQDVFFVVSGKVRVVNYSLSGREVTLDDCDAGIHFGELAAIDGQPRSASVMALEDSLIASMSPDTFRKLLIDHPGVAVKVMTHLAQIVRASTERIMDLSTLGANNRVQAELLRQARNALDGENRAVIKPIPVHSDIASRVSTTRETVARVMNDLARKEILERRKDSLVIVDVNELQTMVEEVRGE